VIFLREKQTMLKVMQDLLRVKYIRPLRRCGFTLVGVLTVSGLVGCSNKPPTAAPPPPPDVTVAHPVQKEVIEWDTYTGFLESPESANVAARVSGLIVQMPFVEGSIVKKGDLLAVIDERPFKADLDAKQADEKKAEAALAIANITSKRLIGLIKTDAVAQQDVDNAQANVDQAEATLASAKAAVELSKLNLEWCRVLSPIDGRVSSKLVTVGNLVNGGQGQATLLTTIQSVSPMYCYVDVDENSVLKYQKLAQEGKLTSTRDAKVPCYAQLANETSFPHGGYIDFSDNHIDATTGTQRVRGIFKNHSGLLTPGFFARLSVPGSGRYQALLIPDTAIGNDQSQRNVLVVDKDNNVSARPVELGALFGGMRSIVSGLSENDLVVINGQMHARPGMTVKPTEAPIKLDAQAFADPGSEIARTIPTTESSAAEPAMDASLTQISSQQSTIGPRQ
jgi:membrane fusion protein, multidrug efflux system